MPLNTDPMPHSEILEALAGLAPDFSEPAINALFRTCLAQSGVKLKTPAAAELMQRLWNSDSVIAAIEAVQDEYERRFGLAKTRATLLNTINTEIRNAAIAS
jgi:hypothetical protein